MRYELILLSLFLVTLALPAFASSNSGAPELMVYFDISSKKLVFKELSSNGSVDTVTHNNDGTTTYTASAISATTNMVTELKVKSEKNTFHDDGKKIKVYENRFTAINKKKLGWDYELIGRVEKNKNSQRFKVGGTVYKMVEYSTIKDTTTIYERKNGKLKVVDTVPGHVSLYVRTENGLLIAYLDLEE